MTPLQWEIRKIVFVNRDGSRTTQYQRRAMLFRFADEIHKLGHRDTRVMGLGNRHVNRAVGHWKQRGLSDATIRNRLSAIRWLRKKINKPNLGYDRNARFGLTGQPSTEDSKAKTLTVSVTRQVADPYIRVSLKLQAAVGLRRSEAMKIQLRWADRGTTLALKGSWIKGGRPQEIPIRTGYRRRRFPRKSKDTRPGGADP